MGKFLNPRFLVSTILIASFISISRLAPAVAAQQLHTDSRWIVDSSGTRVKLACVNWPSHLQPVLAEGLGNQPADRIAQKIRDMGFNCVRFTWPLELPNNDTLASRTVEQSFQSLRLNESLAGIKANNPSIVDLSLMEAFKAVLTTLEKNNVMVILDNHLTIPGWCCGLNDGNGFFGDKYFDPNVWIKGLHKMATMAANFSNVIGMSLRNELRGPRENADDWFKYMQQGAETVHTANPNVLVILSGLNYDKDFSFLHEKSVNVSFKKKLVFEMHWYSFSNGNDWESGNPNDVCGRVSNNQLRMSGFLLDQEYPLFVSEFGIDGRGMSVNDNRYFSCFLAMAVDYDWDFAVWALQGSYYLREGVLGMEEFYGLLDYNWREVRNSSILHRLSVLQSPFKGPGVQQALPHKIIFHPSSGLCVVKKSPSPLSPLILGPCSQSQSWNYTSQQTLRLIASPLYLQAIETGKPVSIGESSTNPGSKWKMVSASKMHLSSKANDGSTVCLDVDENNVVVISTCKCMSGDKTCDPSSQWFKLVDSTRA